MKLNEQSSNWTNTDKIDYLNKKSDSDNFETQIVKKDGEDVYQYRKKTQSSTTTSSLPNWVPDCLKNNFNLKPTNPPTQVYEVIDGHKWHFEEPKNGKNRFIYINSSNKSIYGTWECQSDGNVFIKTDDGEQYSTKDDKWVKQPSTSSSTPQKKRGTIIKPDNPEVMDITFTYKYPGDKNWIYGVKGGDWFAKNVKNQNVFNISKDGFQTSVDRLNATFPDALKTENNKEPEKETNTNTNEPNVQVRPDKNTFTKMKQDADKLPKDIGFKPKYPTTPEDSIDGGQKVLNKQEEPTIYNIDSNKNEL
jgi:hypothetical protein